MVKIGVYIYYGKPYRGTCPTCGQVFLDPCGEGHIALRERFCSNECAKNFKWDIRKGKEMLAQLNGLATHQDIEDAIAAAVLNGVIEGVTK
jgi:hypothetical protein